MNTCKSYYEILSEKFNYYSIRDGFDMAIFLSGPATRASVFLDSLCENVMNGGFESWISCEKELKDGVSQVLEMMIARFGLGSSSHNVSMIVEHAIDVGPKPMIQMWYDKWKERIQELDEEFRSHYEKFNRESITFVDEILEFSEKIDIP